VLTAIVLLLVDVYELYLCIAVCCVVRMSFLLSGRVTLSICAVYVVFQKHGIASWHGIETAFLGSQRACSVMVPCDLESDAQYN